MCVGREREGEEERRRERERERENVRLMWYLDLNIHVVTLFLRYSCFVQLTSGCNTKL